MAAFAYLENISKKWCVVRERAFEKVVLGVDTHRQATDDAAAHAGQHCNREHNREAVDLNMSRS